MAIPAYEAEHWDAFCVEKPAFCEDDLQWVAVPWAGKGVPFKAFKPRAMRYSPFDVTLFLDNDATLLPRHARAIDAIGRRFVFSGADLSGDRESDCATSTCTRRRRLPEEAPAFRGSATCVFPSHKNDDHAGISRLRIFREINTGTVLLRSRRNSTRLFLERWEHVIGVFEFVPGHLGVKDQPALVVAFADTLPSFVDLERLTGFPEARSCCQPCPTPGFNWTAAPPEVAWGFDADAPNYPESLFECRCFACHSSRSASIKRLAPPPPWKDQVPARAARYCPDLATPD